jgi:hypothetical protein
VLIEEHRPCPTTVDFIAVNGRLGCDVSARYAVVAMITGTWKSEAGRLVVYGVPEQSELGK